MLADATTYAVSICAMKMGAKIAGAPTLHGLALRGCAPLQQSSHSRAARRAGTRPPASWVRRTRTLASDLLAPLVLLAQPVSFAHFFQRPPRLASPLVHWGIEVE